MAVTNPWMILWGGIVLGAILQLIWLPSMLKHYGSVQKGAALSALLSIGTGVLICALGALIA